MSKSNDLETDWLLLLFNNTNIANIGDATGLRGSSAAGSLYLALHSADPGEAGNQSTNEVTYSGYARKAVARSSAGFTVSGNSVVLAADQDFTISAGGGSAATHWSVGYQSGGATKIAYKGALNNSIPCQNAGVTPRMTTGTTITED
jgi:hypothetical protein